MVIVARRWTLLLSPKMTSENIAFFYCAQSNGITLNCFYHPEDLGTAQAAGLSQF
jgi:hypothetical protein